MSKNTQEKKMRVSFDLDEVLFVYPKTHKTEPELTFPFNRIFKERLRLGTPELINKLQELGYEVWASGLRHRISWGCGGGAERTLGCLGETQSRSWANCSSQWLMRRGWAVRENGTHRLREKP